MLALASAIIALLGPELTWEAPPECPTVADVEAGVDRLLAVGVAERKPASGAIAPVGPADGSGGFELTVTVDGATRRVSAATCEPLGAVAALIIAVAHDPLSVAVAIPASNAAEVVDPPPVESEPQPPPETAPPADPPLRAATRRWGPRGAVLPFLGLGGGLLPGAGVGFGLVAAVLGGRAWRAEADGSAWLPRRAEARDDPAFAADLWLAGASLRACGVPRGRRAEFPLCVGPQLGALVGNGRGPGVATRRSSQLWVAATASAGVVIPVRRFIALAVRAELVVPVRRPGVHIRGVGFVHRIGPAAGRLFLGPELRFP